MRKKTLFIFLAYTFACEFSFAQQGLSNNWLMGYQSAAGYPGGQTLIDFYNGTPVLSYDSLEMDFRHTHSNVSDNNGNVLFYTNGYYLADASNDTMQNGSGINPSAYTTYFSDGLGIPQANIIIPKPNNADVYYLFHSTVDTFPGYSHSRYLYYSIIDMTLNGGFGAVTSKNQILITDSLNYGKIAACKHANGRDWWVICHKLNSNKFFKLLITPTAILGPYTQDIGNIRVAGAGESWFSPNGEIYAHYWKNAAGIGSLEILSFDRCNGAFSNAVSISVPYENGTQVGLAFSSNSNALYVSNVFHIYQYDLTAANVAASQLTVATYDSFVSVFPGFPQGFATLFGLSALAPDGKIYITTGNGTIHMHTIDNPDVIGLGCNVNQHSVQLPSIYFNTLPNHPNYFLGCDTTLGCTTCYTGVDKEQKNNLTARASPNPSNGIFTLQFDVQSTAGELEIFDVMGNMVWRDYVAPWSQYKRVNIDGLAKGIYLCKLKWGGVERNLKVVKE